MSKHSDAYKKSDQYANSIFDLINGDHLPTVDDLKLKPGPFRWCADCGGDGTSTTLVYGVRSCQRCTILTTPNKKERV